MAKARSSPENALGRQSPIRDAFIKRSAHVIERLAERADDATLVEAMAAPTDFGTLTRVLTDVGVIGTAVAELPVATTVASTFGACADDTGDTSTGSGNPVNRICGLCRRTSARPMIRAPRQ